MAKSSNEINISGSICYYPLNFRNEYLDFGDEIDHESAFALICTLGNCYFRKFTTKESRRNITARFFLKGAILLYSKMKDIVRIEG